MRSTTRRLRTKLRVLRGAAPTPRVIQNTITANSLAHLQKALGWSKPINLNYAFLHEFDYLIDINDRRINDASVVASACANVACTTVVEIGTGQGHTTAIMAEHAPNATVYTVNIPPEEILTGGKLTTYAPSRDQIGEFYRARGCTNVKQIYANTNIWTPTYGRIDVAFIDGCHDAEFVYSDSVKVLKECRPGSVIMWHDFAPDLMMKYDWIRNVCIGVEWLFTDGIIRGPILQLKDSWVGLYRVPEHA